VGHFGEQLCVFFRVKPPEQCCGLLFYSEAVLEFSVYSSRAQKGWIQTVDVVCLDAKSKSDVNSCTHFRMEKLGTEEHTP